MPEYFESGEGIVARGGFVIGIQWKTHKLVSASLQSRRGEMCWIHSAVALQVMDDQGNDVQTTKQGEVYSFATAGGRSYSVREGN